MDWLEESSHRWVRQKEDLYVLHEPQHHVPPEDSLRRAAEEASRASQPEEVMRPNSNPSPNPTVTVTVTVTLALALATALALALT